MWALCRLICVVMLTKNALQLEPASSLWTTLMFSSRRSAHGGTMFACHIFSSLFLANSPRW